MSPLRMSWWTSPWDMFSVSSARIPTTFTRPVAAEMDSARASRKSPTKTAMGFPNFWWAAGLPRRRAAPIDKVVVEQRGGVQVLQRRRKGLVVVPGVPADPCGQHHQQRPQALAAAEEDVTGDLPDQVQVRVQVVRQGLFDGREIASHRLQDPLFEIAGAFPP